jgi:hypothetical protein
VNVTKEHQGDDGFAQYIDPKDGDISGVVAGFSKAPTKFQPECVIVELLLDDGSRRALWLTSTVLASQMAQVAPKLGERIEVHYKGKREGANGEYHDFKVAAPEREPFSPDWNAIAEEAEQGMP